MYNLFVAQDINKWNKPYFTYQIDRVFEHTIPSLRQRYGAMGDLAKRELMSFPSVFAYEKEHQIDARIGWMNNIIVTRNFVEIEFEFDQSFQSIPSSSLITLASKLDIDNSELNRTHWAVKNVDLLNILFEAKIIQDKNVKELSVFLCYASEDRVQAERLHSFLSSHGIKAWLDKKDILPGQDWETEIQNAIRKSHIVVVCLSTKSITKEGFVQKELRTAIDIAKEKPEKTIFIIPTRLEDCEVPNSLSKYQWVDLFSDDGSERLLKALLERAKSLGIRIKSNRPI